MQKSLKTVLKTSLTLLILYSAPAQAKTYSLDSSHLRVGFKVSHLVIATVNGEFTKYSGSFEFDETTKKLSNLSVTIDAASINTNEPDRDKHLRSEDFFNVTKYPHITFKSTNVEEKAGTPVKVHGDLTMAGVTKPVVLDVNYKGHVTDPWGNEKLVFEASALIDRKNWGITWNKNLDKGGVAVGNEVTILIEGEASAKTKP